MAEVGVSNIEIKQNSPPKVPLSGNISSQSEANKVIGPENKKPNLLDCDKWSRELEAIKPDTNGKYGKESVISAKKLISRLFRNKSILDESLKNGNFKDIEISIGILDRVLHRAYLSTKDDQMLKHTQSIILFGRDAVVNNIENLDKLMESKNTSLQSKRSILETVNSLFQGGPGHIVDIDTRIPASFRIRHFEEIVEGMAEQRDGLSIDDEFITGLMSSLLLYSSSEEENVSVKPFMEKLFVDSNPELRNIYCFNFFKALRIGPDWHYCGDTVRVIVKNFLSRQVGKVNSGKIVENWQQAWVIKGGYEGGEALYRNLSSLYNLECIRPGIGQVLFEQFGISDFGRYPQELLIAQYDERDKKDNVPYGIIINPVDDHNGAFYKNMETFQKLYGQIKDRYRVKVWEVKNLRELVHAINDSRHKYGPISFAVIGGHGTEKSIHFGETFEIRNAELLKTDLQRKGSDSMKLAFAQDPTIILNSCTTGALEGIGQEISKMGARVIAPLEPISISRIYPSIDLDGKLEFRVEYGKHDPSPKIYKEGVLQK